MPGLQRGFNEKVEHDDEILTALMFHTIRSSTIPPLNFNPASSSAIRCGSQGYWLRLETL